MKMRGITFFTGENSDIKYSLAERFNSTLQSKMWRYFTHKNTYTYIDVLQDLVYSYNHTFHVTSPTLGNLLKTLQNGFNAKLAQ